ncbi:c-type cytochrome [Caenimonas aquaedulcis]|uniref:Cytochrome c n=1 Tax=Caenimonas aquaedulcis TaxID=2793270 RepID=A0A931MI03_9BURK|nr:cytochrome c [Caenimonas aquaedulcis]MBG9388715.1 cytochrome c [Caenimonas aquaedulcis]
MKASHAAIVSIIAMMTATGTMAQFRKPEDAIKYRQSVMFTMGNHFYSRIGAMANGRVPFDAKVAADNADIVVMLSRLPWIAFGPGTEHGITDAKPAIWTEQAKFKDLGEKMQSEVLRLQAASRTGDLDALKSAYRSAANACKSCHDTFTTQ